MVVFAFERYTLDLDRQELLHDGEAVHVEPQVFRVLAYLVEHRHRVVPKTELLDEVWGSRFVGDSAITSRIKAARQAVGDDGTRQRLIKTVHGTGYHFVGEVDARTERVAAGQAGDAELLERDAALEQLTDALDDATVGRGRAVRIGGEPGIGKSSVVRHFLASNADRARVLVGACDDLITPRPFAPLHDLVHGSSDLADALARPSDASSVSRCVVDLLARPPGPTILVIEDVHWADEATLDLLTHLARRISSLPALVVLTYRDTEVDDDHHLLPVLGSFPPDHAVDLELAPLSRDAVTQLVGADTAEEVMQITNGNPFFVTELAGTSRVGMTRSIRHAVLARTSRLPAASREVLSLVAVSPARLEPDLLDVARPGWLTDIAPAERAGIVVVEPRQVRFRHELARIAVLDAIPEASKRQLHTALLEVLVGADADPARLVHHAEAAGDTALVAASAARAARAAATMSAHREAHSQFQRALAHTDEFESVELAAIYEDASREAYLAADNEHALEWARAALADYEVLDDPLGAGRVHRWLSRLQWFAGRGEEAWAEAAAAVEVLEPLGPSVELAWAYSNRSQLDMLAYRGAPAIEWGEKAVQMATDLGDDVIRAHALINIGIVRVGADHEDSQTAIDGAELAAKVGEHHEATRALLGVAFSSMLLNRLEPARAMGQRALDHAREHEVDALANYVVAILARIDLMAGRWDEAEGPLRQVVAEGPPLARLLALMTLALLEVRRGDDADETMAHAWPVAEATNEPQRLAPMAAVEAERHWLAGDLSGPTRQLREVHQMLLDEQPSIAGELARWLAAAGEEVAIHPDIDEPYRLELEGRWIDAAASWEERGMPYDRALCLARSGDRASVAAAIEIADELGAGPLARWAREHLPEE